jgi:hypothetical protein
MLQTIQAFHFSSVGECHSPSNADEGLLPRAYLAHHHHPRPFRFPTSTNPCPYPYPYPSQPASQTNKQELVALPNPSTQSVPGADAQNEAATRQGARIPDGGTVGMDMNVLKAIGARSRAVHRGLKQKAGDG